MREPIKRSFWIKLTLVPILMFGFAFALVPIYTVLCEITGLNGTTGQIDFQAAKQYKIDENRTVMVDFTASVATGFPINFTPKEKQMMVVPGKIYTMHYIAENRSDVVVTGQAVPSVAPSTAALSFKKLECFCFTRQVFQPKKPVEMPVRFVVEPKLDKNINNITLSYNFFKVK